MEVRERESERGDLECLNLECGIVGEYGEGKVDQRTERKEL